uniref:DNA ligase IV n=1 Tax=Strongyloides venezuelensis TaxID=75913 RepID=A0A0K0G421_STRVS
MGHSTADFVGFYELCKFFDDISAENDKRIKEELFENFVERWFKSENEDFSIYPVLRLMVQSNNIEECLFFEYHHLVKNVSNSLGFDITIPPQSGDLSTLDKVALLLKWYPDKSHSSKISVATLNKYIDQFIENKSRKNSIHEMLTDMSNLERKWFLIILLSEVENVTNMKFDTLIWCLNPALGQLLIDGYKLNHLLSEYHPKTFNENVFKKKLMSISIGKPFFPMILNDFGYTKGVFSAIQRFCKGKLLASDNYDGERIIMHRYNNGENYKFFSDTMDDFTRFYISSNYDFSKEIEPFFKNNIRNIILEGKMLVQCSITLKLHEKFDESSDGTFYDTRFMDGNDKNKNICFVVSDILYINNSDLSEYPLGERLNILNDNIFNELNGKTVRILEHKEVISYEDFFERLKESLIRMQEGYILKDSDSTYISGSVPIKHCVFKIKPNYTRFVTLNFYIVGVEYSEDRPSFIKYFILGARDSNDNITICLKVRATTKSELFYKIMDSINIKNNYCNEQPPWLKGSVENNSHVRFTDENNITIVEVKWSKINSGTEELSYIYAIRNDLSRENVNFLSDVEYFNTKFKGGLDNIEVLPYRINNLYRGDNNTKRSFIEIDNIGYWNFFEQLTVCVLNCQENFDIKKIQKFIYYLGGSIVAHPTKETCFVIASDPTNVKTAAALHMRSIPILDSSWPIRCINERKLQKIDLESDVLLMEGSNQFSIENLNDLIVEQDIPDVILNNICM